MLSYDNHYDNDNEKYETGVTKSLKEKGSDDDNACKMRNLRGYCLHSERKSKCLQLRQYKAICKFLFFSSTFYK